MKFLKYVFQNAEIAAGGSKLPPATLETDVVVPPAATVPPVVPPAVPPVVPPVKEEPVVPPVPLHETAAFKDAVAAAVLQAQGDINTSAAATVEADNKIFAQVATAFEGVTTQTGAETWAELSTWAKDTIPNAQRVELNALIKSGGIAAQLAVQELVSAFKNGYTGEAQLMQGDPTKRVNTSNDITRIEYMTQVEALMAKGHDYNTSSEIKALQARRAKSMRKA